MPQINRSENLFSFAPQLINAPGWETITNEEWNQLIAGGWACNQYVPPHRVTKDTITSRVLEAGKLPDLIALISSLPADQQFLWSGFSWFWSSNATIRGMAAQLGLDPDQILAPDPYLQ